LLDSLGHKLIRPVHNISPCPVRYLRELHCSAADPLISVSHTVMEP